jgi:amino acid transporter
MAVVGHRIGRGPFPAQHRRVNAFPLPTPPRTVVPRRLLGGVAVAVAVLLSIWMLIAAGLQRDDLDSGPGPLPDVPMIVDADLGVGAAAEIAPAPGADISPMEGSVSPR